MKKRLVEDLIIMNGKKLKHIILKTIIILLFAAGIGLLLYPAACDIYNKWQNARMQEEYKRHIEKNSVDQNRQIWVEARAYNREHDFNIIVDAFDKDDRIADTPNYRYKDILNVSGNGMMGYIEIPKIDISLSIFHGVSSKTLEQGAGHLAGTSMPVGGKDSHCVLAAHRGLPSAKLFTDLDQMKKGDRFYIHILDRTLAYKIDYTNVIRPKALTENLDIVPRKDLVTLVTCTPYCVNTHRLLVRGYRVPLDKHEEINPLRKYIIYGLFILGVIVLSVVFYVGRKKKYKKT